MPSTEDYPVASGALKIERYLHAAADIPLLTATTHVDLAHTLRTLLFNVNIFLSKTVEAFDDRAYRLLADGLVHSGRAVGLLNLDSAGIPLRFRGRLIGRGEPVLDSVEHDGVFFFKEDCS